MDASLDISELLGTFLPVHEGAEMDLELDIELLGQNGVNAFRQAYERAYRSLFRGESLEIHSMQRTFKYGRDMMIIGLRKKAEE